MRADRVVECLGVKFHALSMSETLELIEERIERRVFTQHVVVNAAKVVNMRSNPELKQAVFDCDVINADGMGVVWGARLLGAEVPERVAGIDIFLKLLDLSARRFWPVYFLGATSEVCARAQREALKLFPALQVAGSHHGFFDAEGEQEIVRNIRASGAKLLFVAMSSPKKETFIERWKGQLGVDFVMGVGGSFDVLAGLVRRAPEWMQRNGLEWLYRVLQEPRRMWRRYAVTNTIFVYLLAREKMFRSLRALG